MKIKLTYNIILFIVALSLLGCNSSSNTKKLSNKKSSQGINNNMYFPLAEGNKWEYVNEGPREETEIYKVEVKNMKSDGKDYLIELSSFPFFSKKEESTKLRIKGNGEIYVIVGSNEELCFPSADNMKNGFSWKYGEWNGSVNNWKDSVKTEYGVFDDCLYLNYSISITFSAEIWIVKDIGIVKWAYVRTNPPTLKPTYYVLRNTELNK